MLANEKLLVKKIMEYVWIITDKGCEKKKNTYKETVSQNKEKSSILCLGG